METAATKAIKNAKVVGKVLVIESKFGKFSPVTDRVEVERLLVFTNEEATYFGKKIQSDKNIQDIEGLQTGADPEALTKRFIKAITLIKKCSSKLD